MADRAGSKSRPLVIGSGTVTTCAAVIAGERAE